MTHPDWKEAAEKWLKNFIQQHTHEDEVSPMEWADPEDIGRDGYIAGAKHACEQLKQQISERDAEIQKLQEAVKWYKAAHELFAKHAGGEK